MGFLKLWFLQILGCQKPCPYLGRLQQAFICLCIPRWLDLLSPTVHSLKGRALLISVRKFNIYWVNEYFHINSFQ